jgi:transitional endoplasmic reticulum ATPase
VLLYKAVNGGNMTVKINDCATCATKIAIDADIDPLLNDNISDDLDAISTKMHKPANKGELVIKQNVLVSGDQSLFDESSNYAMWLRAVVLRMMINTQALSHAKDRSHYGLSKVTEFLGLENFNQFTSKRELNDIKKPLVKMLNQLEKTVGKTCHFPEVLKQNLAAVAELVGLNELECDILGLVVILHSESTFETCCELLGSELTGYNIERELAPMMGRKKADIAKCLEKTEKLAMSGLLTVDLSSRYSLLPLLDLLTNTFAPSMLSPQADIRNIVAAYVRKQKKSDLTESDYQHVQKNVDICKAILINASSQLTAGVNILIYGKPGLGKTEFARMLADSIELQLMEITTASLAGTPVIPSRRLRNFRISQAFFKTVPTVLLFDECEEVLNPSRGFDSHNDENAIPRKSWINQMLETNCVPTIWIANSIDEFDAAYLRRFNYCFEMPAPTKTQRETMLKKAFGELVSDKTQLHIAGTKTVSPALLVQTASVLTAIGVGKTLQERDELTIHLMNNSLKATGCAVIRQKQDIDAIGGGFNPDWVNSEKNLNTILNSIEKNHAARLCLYGPPGTGKTAMGKWLAKSLDLPHIIIKASDLLGMYVGETEKNITAAFELAKEQKAVLQFDEVDTFLQSRQQASQQWVVTQVNAMLVEMENFDGIFIASTNLFGNLDEASLRRFDMAIKFDYLKSEIALEMFNKTCETLGLTNFDNDCQNKIKQLKYLTPGDFEQVVRCNRLTGFDSAFGVYSGLESAVKLKKKSASSPIGFLHAA